MVSRPRKAPKKPAQRAQAEVCKRVIESGGIDPETIDPRRILAGIASDPEAPAGARVMACKTLLVAAGEQSPGAATEATNDALTRRALQLLSTGKAN
jgi:hypothetical protein